MHGVLSSFGILLLLLGGVSATSYVHGNGELLAKVNESGVYYYHSEHLGSTSAVTNAVGEVKQTVNYLPFGEEFTSDPDSRFTGKEFDSDSGIYYSMARYYNPNSGRFLNSDPIRDGMNWYCYANNNPLRYVDPDGQKTESLPAVPRSGTLDTITGPSFGPVSFFANLFTAFMFMDTPAEDMSWLGKVGYMFSPPVDTDAEIPYYTKRYDNWPRRSRSSKVKGNSWFNFGVFRKYANIDKLSKISIEKLQRRMEKSLKPAGPMEQEIYDLFLERGGREIALFTFEKDDAFVLGGRHYVSYEDMEELADYANANGLTLTGIWHTHRGEALPSVLGGAESDIQEVYTGVYLRLFDRVSKNAGYTIIGKHPEGKGGLFKTSIKLEY